MDNSGNSVYTTLEGIKVPVVTAAQMKMVDELAENSFQLGVLQMMENAGRNMASHVESQLEDPHHFVTVLAGSGGNGGGGLAAARHLNNRGWDVRIILSRKESELVGPAKAQWAVLKAAGLVVQAEGEVHDAIANAKVVIDALIGYSLQGAPRGRTRELIDSCNQVASNVVSLDVPSGLDATSGETPGAVVSPQQILTLALPKTGLAITREDLFLGDIGIPPALYRHLGIELPNLFDRGYVIRLVRSEQ